MALGRGLMSETSTSHMQWIQHAVAAAKAGNPFVAKIQLQKAAEEAPGNPAVWLWMRWLADSPASAAQCLELARSDKRFEKIAVTGIEFSKALADFQLDQFAESVEANGSTAKSGVAEQDGMTLDPVEAVEEVVAAVESLQHEDSTDHAAGLAEESTELVAEELVEPESDPDAVCGGALDAASTEPPAVSDFQEVSSESISDESNEENPDVAETCAEQPSESSADNNVEAALMESANELWQINDEMIVEAVPATDEAPWETNTDQQLWQPASAESSPTPVSDVSRQATSNDQSISVDNENEAAPIVESASVVEQVLEVIPDESEDDFAFAADDNTELGTVLPPHGEPSPTNRAFEHPQNDGDQWLGQEPAETPRAPVWRKAQSDWFSVDGPSEREPDQLALPANPVTSTPISAVPFEQTLHPATSAAEQEPSPPVRTPATESLGVDSVIEAKSKAAVPRVTPSDVWQTAAIEKSAMIEAPVAQPPIYQPSVVQNPARTDFKTGTLAERVPQSPTVASMSDSSVFFAADPSNGQPSIGNAKSQDQKTVLVVDDSPTVRKLVAITLEKRGYKVVSAFDDVAAIKEIAAHNPSLILMDVNMPRLDEYQLCKLVKKHETTCDIPVLMLTGKDGMFDRIRGRLVGCAGSVAKPFTPEELLEFVEQNIKSSESGLK
jgi:twitching motility two-component system response regulator PilG